jgi:hypothetical protein
VGLARRRRDRAVLNRRRQLGAATVEFYLVALLALLPLCLGMVQTSLLLIANHHIDHAAFMATRAGATQKGDIAVMRREFARVLTPLFVEATGGVNSGNVAARVGAAQIRATVDIAAFVRIRLLSPSPAAQRDFVIRREGVDIIPNDSLEHRTNRPGAESRLSLQQVNMLRVEYTYCQSLVVPFIRGTMTGFLRRLDPEPSHQLCYAEGRLPIRSVGSAPMQSDFRVRG